MEFSLTQQRAINAVMNGKHVCITGGAGTGKSHVLRELMKSLPNAIVVAPTNLAASHVNGRTIHSVFKFSVSSKLSSSDLARIACRDMKRSTVATLKTIVIDEVSMVTTHIFKAMDEALRNVAKDIKSRDMKLGTTTYTTLDASKPFAGVQIIAIGDFCQLPPVITAENEGFCDGIVHLFMSNLWNSLKMEIVILDTVFRQGEDPAFAKLLEAMRFGVLDPMQKAMLTHRLHAKLPELNGIKPTRLYSHRMDVDKINNDELQLIRAESIFFTATYKDLSIESRRKPRYDQRRANAIEAIGRSSQVSNRFELRVGAQIMLTERIEGHPETFNGMRGIVEGVTEDMVKVRLVSDELITVKHMSRDIEFDDDLEFTRTFMPIRLAWAITVHKAQGMTLDMVILNIDRCFQPGQAYVAFSRCKTLKCIRIEGTCNFRRIWADPEVVRFCKVIAQQPNATQPAVVVEKTNPFVERRKQQKRLLEKKAVDEQCVQKRKVERVTNFEWMKKYKLPFGAVSNK